MKRNANDVMNAFDTIVKAINTNGETSLEIIGMLNDQKKDSALLRIETKIPTNDPPTQVNETPSTPKETKEEPIVPVPAASPPTALAVATTPSTISSATPQTGDSESQKIFGKLPPELMTNGLTRPQLMRLSVIYEMVETEADYIRDLNLMINVRLIHPGGFCLTR